MHSERAVGIDASVHDMPSACGVCVTPLMPHASTVHGSLSSVGVGSTTLLTQTTTDQSGAQTTEQLPRTILTLALTQAQAERIIFAQGHGELSMGLLTEESVVKQSLGVNGRNLFQ